MKACINQILCRRSMRWCSSSHCQPSTALQNTALPELVRGKHNLKNEVSERTGQLKALVKENFDRFISCKNTIDDIHKRLRKSEAHDSLSASGNSTADLVIAISEVFCPFWILFRICNVVVWSGQLMKAAGVALHSICRRS